MGSHRQRFLHDLATLRAFLRGEARIDSYQCVTSSLSLFTQDSEECAPGGVHDALCQGRISYHVENHKFLHSDHLIVFRVLLSRLIVEVTALTGDLEMCLRGTLRSLAASVRTFLAAA